MITVLYKGTTEEQLIDTIQKIYPDYHISLKRLSAIKYYVKAVLPYYDCELTDRDKELFIKRLDDNCRMIK